jgi:hypothetical protein
MNRALANVRFYVDNLSYDMTPAELLAVSTIVIDLGFKLRDSVTKAFAVANARAVKDTAKVPVNHLRLVPKGVTVLDLGTISPEDLHNALAVAIGEKKL